METTSSPRPRPRWIALVLVAASLAVGWPLLLPRIYDTHDGHYAYYNAAQFELALRDGQIPVRWLPDLFGGRGLPVFLYYHPLAFYLAAFLQLTGLGAIASVKLLVLATLPLSGWAMLAWLEEHVPSAAAAIGAAAYVAAPIHVVEIHVKGDPPAALAFVFAPLVLLAVRRAAAGAPRAVPALACASAGLVLAHSVTALLLMAPIALYAIAVLPRPAWAAARRVGSGATLGALLSVWHWGPALAERALVYIDTPRGILAFDWREQFVAWWQLFSPLWGYHGSFPGTPDDMSFQIGPAHVAVLALGVAAWRRGRGTARGLAAWGLAAAAFAIVMTLPVSRAAWEAIDALDYVQYPFRFLMPAALATAALAAAAAATLPASTVAVACGALPPALTGLFALVERSPLYAAIALFQAVAGGAAIVAATRGPGAGRRAAPATAALFVALALPWSAVPLHHRLKGEPAIVPLHESDLAPERVRLGIRRTTARDDYLPRTVAEGAIPPRDPSQEYLPPPGAEPAPPLEVRGGDARTVALTKTASALRFETVSDGGAIVALDVHDFPGWTLTLAGPPAWRAEPLAHGHDDAGRIVVSIPPGRWIVEARWGETPLRRRCDAASILGLVIAAGMFLRGGGSSRPRAV